MHAYTHTYSYARTHTRILLDERGGNVSADASLVLIHVPRERDVVGGDPVDHALVDHLHVCVCV
jgi:hypothetical protein